MLNLCSSGFGSCEQDVAVGCAGSHGVGCHGQPMGGEQGLPGLGRLKMKLARGVAEKKGFGPVGEIHRLKSPARSGICFAQEERAAWLKSGHQSSQQRFLVRRGHHVEDVKNEDGLR